MVSVEHQPVMVVGIMAMETFQVMNLSWLDERL